MNDNGLKPRIRRGWRPAKPEDLSKPETRVGDAQNICPRFAPNVLWAGDFTYIWFLDRFWYVATVIDIYTRNRGVGTLPITTTTSLIMDAFSDAAR